MLIPEMTPCIGEFMYCFGDSYTTTDFDDMLIYLSENDSLENNIGITIDIYNSHRLSFLRTLNKNDVGEEIGDGIFELIGEESYNQINQHGLLDGDKINYQLAKTLDQRFENEKFAYGAITGQIVITENMLKEFYED